eukprot:6198972-Pleurochrysis_carterae.AAC.1
MVLRHCAACVRGSFWHGGRMLARGSQGMLGRNWQSQLETRVTVRLLALQCLGRRGLDVRQWQLNILVGTRSSLFQASGTCQKLLSPSASPNKSVAEWSCMIYAAPSGTRCP